MPKYFLNVHDAVALVQDEEGSDHRELSGAIAEAQDSARDLVKQFVDEKKSALGSFIEITDSNGLALATLPVIEVVEYPDRPAFKAMLDLRAVTALNPSFEEAERDHLVRKSAILRERRAVDERDTAEDLRWAAACRQFNRP